MAPLLRPHACPLLPATTWSKVPLGAEDCPASFATEASGVAEDRFRGRFASQTPDGRASEPKRCRYRACGNEEAPLVKLLRVWFFLLVTLSTVPVSAHVVFTAPENGETVLVGQQVTVTWVDAVVHDGVGYDLEYAGNLLAQGLPTSTHSFVWVPTAPCTCQLRVTQVNVGEDYIAEIDVTVVAPEPPTRGTGGAAGAAAAGSSSMSSGGAPSPPAGGAASAGTATGGSGGGASGGVSAAGGDAVEPTPSEAGAAAMSTAGGEPSSAPPAPEAGSAAGDSTTAPDVTASEGGAATLDDVPRSREASCAVSQGATTSSSVLLLLFAVAAGFRCRRPQTTRMVRSRVNA
jgi:hypothetical protein